MLCCLLIIILFYRRKLKKIEQEVNAPAIAHLEMEGLGAHVASVELVPSSPLTSPLSSSSTGTGRSRPGGGRRDGPGAMSTGTTTADNLSPKQVMIIASLHEDDKGGQHILPMEGIGPGQPSLRAYSLHQKAPGYVF